MFDLQRRRDQDGALGRQFVQIGKRGQAVAIVLVQQVVRREGRRHAARLPGIRADALRPPADDPL